MAAKRALIYTRISRDDTGEGAAIERQEEDCRKLCDLRGWEVVDVESDLSISAYSGKTRPGWERTLEAIKSGEVDVVVAWHMDRMTRSMVDLENLILLAEDHGAGVTTVTGDIDLTTDVGRMVARILAAVARQEVERKGERQRRANEQRARQGEFRTSGFRPFGYTMEGQVIEEEATLICEAADNVLRGAPLREIVRRWRELGVSTPRSRKDVDGWTHNSVRSILLNPRNAGLSTYKGEVVAKGHWDPILSEETHVLLVATLTDPARTRGDKSLGNKPRNLLSGIATCGECGFPVEAGSSAGRKVYKCTNPDGDHLTTGRQAVEDELRQRLLAMGADFDAIVKPDRLEKPVVPDELWEHHETLNGRLNKLASSWAEGALTDEQLEAGTSTLREQLADVERQINEAVEGRRLVRPSDVDGTSELNRFLEADLWEQRRTLEQVATVKLWPKYRKRNVPTHQQLSIHLQQPDGSLYTVLDDRPTVDPSASEYERLADVLTEEQPEGVTTLAKAAQWLADNEHTQRSPGGLPSKLSPLVRYVRGETRNGNGWTRKGSSGRTSDDDPTRS